MNTTTKTTTTIKIDGHRKKEEVNKITTLY